MNHRFCPLCAAILFATGAAASATPSGLNNIPTADTTPWGTAVLQAFSTLGSDRDADLNLGFKSGIDLGPVDFEFGLASHLLPDEGGPVTVHGKLALPFGEGLPSLALGSANIAFSDDDRDRAGDPFNYIVLSHDAGWFRVHGGCGLQDGDALPFIGFDKTFRVETSLPGAAVPAGKAPAGKYSVPASSVTSSRDLFTLRADAIQQRDSSWLCSAGVLVPVCDWFVFEAWGNFPDNGDDASATVKANFVFKF